MRVGEALDWPVGLGRLPRDAKAFYGTIAVATLIGIGINFIALDPIKALFWSAVVNGVVAVPLMVVMMVMTMRRARHGAVHAAAAAVGDGMARHRRHGGGGPDDVLDASL